MKIKHLLIVGLILAMGPRWAMAFNLITDIEQNTNWDVGKPIVSAGTAIPLKKGQPWAASTFYEFSDYRFLSLWYGFIAKPTGQNILQSQNVNLTDAAKIGLNGVYIFKKFKNQPPAALDSINIGPAVSCPLLVSPRVVEYWIDINWAFGASQTQAPPVEPPSTGPVESPKENITPTPVLN